MQDNTSKISLIENQEHKKFDNLKELLNYLEIEIQKAKDKEEEEIEIKFIHTKW